MILQKPNPEHYPVYYNNYYENIDFNIDIKTTLQISINNLLDWISNADNALLEYAYAPNKWTAKQVILHIADCEIIFQYRLLSIIRGEKNSMLDFDENMYAEQSSPENWNKADLMDYLKSIRNTSAHIINACNETDLNKTGIVNGNSLSALALAYFIPAHQLHHTKVLEQRYNI